MSITEYLESPPFFEIERYHDQSAMDAVSFIGTLRKHPYDPEKCLLLTDRQDSLKWIDAGVIIEFRISDVLAADELPSIVDEMGTARQLVRIWVRRGAIALRYEPFEVNEKSSGPLDLEHLRERFNAFFHTKTGGR